MTATTTPRAPQGGAAPQPLPARSHASPARSLTSRLRLVIASLPWLVRAGFSLLALGGGADLGYHAINGLETHTHGGPSLFAFAIHLVAALGMVLSIVGVFGEGIRSTRRSAAGRRNR